MRALVRQMQSRLVKQLSQPQAFQAGCFRISLDNGNDFLCMGGNCDDRLTDVSPFNSQFFSG